MNVYDFDSTIYNGDSSIDFYLFCLKNKPSLIRFAPKQAWGFVLYALKRIKKTSLKEYFFCFLRGCDAQKTAEAFWDKNQDKVFEWYQKQHREDDIIISASPEFLLRPICLRLGIKHLIASKVDSQSGKFAGENCYGKEKVNRLTKEFPSAHIDEFYSDSHSDLPLAQTARKAFLVKNGTPAPWDIPT